jgi:hypothetical protein
MPQRSFAALVLAVAAVVSTNTLSACSSSGGAGSDSSSSSSSGSSSSSSSSSSSRSGVASTAVDGDLVAVGAAPLPGDDVGSLADAVDVAAGAPGDATDAACTVDRRTLELAVEAYQLLNNALATTQQELLDAQMIRELSVRFDISPGGAVVPAPASTCS